MLSKQLLRCGTAIGALSARREQAESKPDFVHKMAIASTEVNETEYWILLRWETTTLRTPTKRESAINDNKELLKLVNPHHQLNPNKEWAHDRLSIINCQLSTEYREIRCFFFAILHGFVDKNVKRNIIVIYGKNTQCFQKYGCSSGKILQGVYRQRRTY